jgi:hypothetical protein
MDKTKALQKLLNGTATKKEIELLKQALASGEISIGGENHQQMRAANARIWMAFVREFVDGLFGFRCARDAM